MKNRSTRIHSNPITHPLKASKKKKIPRALREQVWVHTMGTVYQGKCTIPWCRNTITVFDFQCGHNIPESKGGATNLQNLLPICSRCNASMSNNYSIDEWSKLNSSSSRSWYSWFIGCLFRKK
jgi:5-methylcytosine-specific restriction endonuclease McrA